MMVMMIVGIMNIANAAKKVMIYRFFHCFHLFNHGFSEHFHSHDINDTNLGETNGSLGDLARYP